MSNYQSNTPYDDVGRTLINDCPWLIIPVVNEIFFTRYDLKENIIFRNNNLFITKSDSSQNERITDTYFLLCNIPYHFELQSTVDNSISKRLFEYDSQIAVKHHSVWDKNSLTLSFPNSAVLCLRHNKNTPDYINTTVQFPDCSCNYQVPLMKVQTYSLDEIFQKDLLFLIPFHLFSYEDDFKVYDSNKSKLDELVHIYSDMVERLEKYPIDAYTKKTIYFMSNKVLEHLASKYPTIKERLGEIMIGNILDYEAKDILNRGKAEGKIEGKKQLSILISKLIEDNLFDIIKLVTSDENACEEYLVKYGIE